MFVVRQDHFIADFKQFIRQDGELWNENYNLHEHSDYKTQFPEYANTYLSEGTILTILAHKTILF